MKVTCLVALVAAAVLAQDSPTFEVAAVKPANNPPGAGFTMWTKGGPGPEDPTRIDFHNVSLGNLSRNCSKPNVTLQIIWRKTLHAIGGEAPCSTSTSLCGRVAVGFWPKRRRNAFDFRDLFDHRVAAIAQLSHVYERANSVSSRT
jgi:hypothetical protein